MAKKTEEAKVKIAVEDFIETWQRAKTIGEVAEKLGITELKARGRANLLRLKGVDSLKKFPRKGTNYAALNEKAEDLL